MQNNAIYGNTGPGAWLNAASYGGVFAHNDVYGNSSAYAGDRGSQTGSNGNLAVDPAFAAVSNDGNGTNDDFHLRAGSGLINTGLSTRTDPDGTRSDIGAYGGAQGAW